jgi:hypothetical protein
LADGKDRVVILVDENLATSWFHPRSFRKLPRNIQRFHFLPDEILCDEMRLDDLERVGCGVDFLELQAQ